MLRHYAQGLAYAATGNGDAFRQEWHALQQRAPLVKAQFAGLVAVANATLAARDAVVRKDFRSAARLMEGASMAQLSWEYFEPPNWHYPLRQCWGELLLQGGAAAAAEAVFRADLTQYLRNGWSLLGLTQAMMGQPEKYSKGDVAAMQAAFDKAWARADVTIASPCPLFSSS